MFQNINRVGAMEGLQSRQGIQSMQEMQALLGYQGLRMTGEVGQQKVKQEFLAIFYKELLKQAFKPPQLGFENEEKSLTGTFGSDLLVERLALELARSGAFSAENLFPSGISE